MDNLCKTTTKTLCKNDVNFCAKLFKNLFNVQKPDFFTNISYSFHHKFHNLPSLAFNYFIHYSTSPTITTTNN